jgi:hypothetical protein
MPFFQTVDIIESEAGWGQKIDETLYFTSKDKASKYVDDYNTKYNPPKAQTPSWYMYATMSSIDELSEEHASKIKVDPTVR